MAAFCHILLMKAHRWDVSVSEAADIQRSLRDSVVLAPLARTPSVIGARVRTKDSVLPVFVFPGHRTTLGESIALTLSCVRKHRVPEPTRQAHVLVNAYRAEAQSIVHTSGMRSVVRYLVILSLLLGALVVATPVAMRYATHPYLYESVEDIPHRQVAIVLGASVYRGKPSPVLERRAARAVELYRAGKVDAILVTGDNGALTHDEVTPVRKYLVEAGIPDADIFLDHAGFDTYSSMYRARAVFLAESATVVTQDFHQPRSLYIARRLGIDALGLIASRDGSEKDYVREIPASVKAVFDLALHRVPKYLGDTHPLDGDGTATWY